MKKRIVLAGVSMALCLLCGCLEATPLTDAEMDVVAEYAATMLLKNDDKYSTPLYYVGVVPEEELEEKLTPTPTPTAAPIITQKPDNNVNNVGHSEGKATPTPRPTPGLYNSEETKKQLTELIAVENISISCEGSEIMDSVVSNDYFSLKAEEGKQYIVIDFKLQNNTAQALTFDASEKGLEYAVDINTGTVSRVSLSMLQNDLQYMPITVPAEGEADAVLVFEIDDEPVETVHLIVEKGEEAVFIKLK